jgi:hypothetical protein
MIKQIMEGLDLTIFAEIGLVLFVVIFLASAAWILLRPRQQVRDWARLALHDPSDKEPRQPSGDGDDKGAFQ